MTDAQGDARDRARAALREALAAAARRALEEGVPIEELVRLLDERIAILRPAADSPPAGEDVMDDLDEAR